MILAEKIVTLRKKNGWSQEELAEKLNVSRQSISKYEGAQSVPDLDKILLLSQIFGVSTDYLLKDEMEEAEEAPVGETYREEHGTPPRWVSMEEANEFLAVKERTAKWIAFATFLCILSPICLLLLSAGTESGRIAISENLAAGAGLCVLLVLVTIAVAIFISCGMKTKRFEYLDQEVIETAYGVSGMVKERQTAYHPTYAMYNIIGTCFCILSAIPIFIGLSLGEDDELIMVGAVCVTLLLVGIGVMFFIIAGIHNESMQKLLQEGDYTVRKKGRVLIRSVGRIYWLVTVALYLGISFVTKEWEYSWIIWPVAGVLYAAIVAICDMIEDRKRK